MARPQRNNVDYFPHEAGSGKKMHYIENKYGNDGYATWYKILEELGHADFHYLDLNQFEVVMFLSAKCRVDEERLLAIVNDLVKLTVFDSELWKSKVIWDQKFADSIQDAYKKRGNACITKGQLLQRLGIRKPDKSIPKPSLGDSEVSVNPQRKEEKRKEDNIYINSEPKFKEVSEADFISIWSRARLHYDKAKTGFDKLTTFERQGFNELKKEYSYAKFEEAVAGLFFQDTLPAVRVRPDHFLKPENFTKYLDCWQNKSKMFDNSKNKTNSGTKFNKGDV